MTDTSSTPDNRIVRQLTELTLLYQFSNTMLSTISLNTLTHLILTALVNGKHALFERAMLFLCNERSGTLQGMLGVTSSNEDILTLVGEELSLSSRWEIADSVMTMQRTTPFCNAVRTSRIDIDHKCPVIKQVVIAQQTITVSEQECLNCPTCTFLNSLGVKNFAAAPLLAHDKTLGIIVVDNPSHSKPATGQSLQFLHLFANQAGMAMENSILYSRIADAHTNLKDARERLVHGERLAAIGEMAANLAHELKNPLVTIGGFAGRLLKSLPEDGKEFHCADTIVKEVARLERMLAEILAFSRKPPICFDNFELASLIAESIESASSSLDEHGIDIVFEPGEQEWQLIGDRHQLKQVFLNLIINACDAMPDGGTITIHANMSSEHANRVVITMTDNGGGIPDEMLHQIFKPFFTTKHHGTGLGLAIVNRIIQNHHGSISAANNNGGAVFTITLPIAKR